MVSRRFVHCSFHDYDAGTTHMSVVKLFKEMELLELSAVCDSLPPPFFSVKYLISFVGKLGGAVIESETNLNLILLNFVKKITLF